MDELKTMIAELEMDVCHLQKMLDTLNDELVKQWKMIDQISKENKELREAMDSNIKPLSEETPPPHY